jgi:spore maturation protein CgeB
MKILFVWTAAQFSVLDVARGYRLALAKAGHDVVDYRLSRRIMYHARALGETKAKDIGLVARLASENVLLEAIRNQVDVVVIIAAIYFHPDGIWFLARCAFPTIVVFTESPYCDGKQVDFAQVHPKMLCGTNERTSAARYGWTYLRPAYDPDVHKPVDPDPEQACDVLMIGTGWKERIRLLEGVDWTGIKLRLLGFWKSAGFVGKDSPLAPFIEEKAVSNSDVPRYYASAKICLNSHRAGDGAESVNPRVVEAAACGAFQLSDARAEMTEHFQWGETAWPSTAPVIPTFDDSKGLEILIRTYLADDDRRRSHATQARKCVQGETFDVRVATLMEAFERRRESVAV